MNSDGPDLSEPVVVSGANEPLNVMDAENMIVSRGAERALVNLVDAGGIKPGEGINGMAQSMMEATAALYTAHNRFEANKGPQQEGPAMKPAKKPDAPST